MNSILHCLFTLGNTHIGGLTCLDDLEADLSSKTLDVRRIEHLTGVGAVEVVLDVMERDGCIVLQNVPRPHHVSFEESLRRRVRLALVIKELHGDRIRYLTRKNLFFFFTNCGQNWYCNCVLNTVITPRSNEEEQNKANVPHQLFFLLTEGLEVPGHGHTLLLDRVSGLEGAL